MNNIYGAEARVALARCDGIAPPPLALLLTVIILHNSPRNLGPQYNINNNVWRVDVLCVRVRETTEAYAINL